MYRILPVLFILLPLVQPLLAAQEPAPVHVYLWFDTEDYILPEADEALFRIARFLSSEDVRATFKLVGEKARVLEERGRQDILAALDHHDVGYHTNFHSVQPTPAMFLAPLGWKEGVEEFNRREYQGFLDVQRITGQKPVCYGQPGSSWGPQQFGSLREWAVPLYLDAGSHIDVDGRPVWYAGVLNLFSLEHTLRTELGGSTDLEEAKQAFQQAYAKIQQEGGGLVSIYYHPCEFVHAEFWDGVNFSKGANPPREEWKLPPMKPAAEIETSYQTFEDYVRFIKGFPGVRFVGAGEAPQIFRDRSRGRLFTTEEIQQVARTLLSDGLSFQEVDGTSISLSETFYLLNSAVQKLLDGRPAEVRLDLDTPLGPFNPGPSPQRAVETTKDQFTRTLSDVLNLLRTQGRVPDAVWLGSRAVDPAAFLVTAAKLAVTLGNGEPAPARITIVPQTADFSRYIRNDKDLWGWVIFPPDFEAPEMMELARRQGWTLKPAIAESTARSGGEALEY